MTITYDDEVSAAVYNRLWHIYTWRNVHQALVRARKRWKQEHEGKPEGNGEAVKLYMHLGSDYSVIGHAYSDYPAGLVLTRMRVSEGILYNMSRELTPDELLRYGLREVWAISYAP